MKYSLLGKIIPNNQKVLNLALIISFLFSIIISFFSYSFFINYSQKYNDLIIGTTTWNGYNKSADYQFIYVYIIALFLSFFTSSAVLNKLITYKDEQIDNSALVENESFISYILFGFSFSIIPSLIIETFLDKFISITNGLYLIIVINSFMGIYFLYYERKNDFNLKSEKISNELIKINLLSIFTYVSSINIFITCKLIFSDFLIFFNSIEKYLILFNIVLLSLLSLKLFKNKYFQKKGNYYLYLAQILVPLSLLVSIDQVFIYNEKIVEIHIPSYTKFIFFMIVLIGILYNLKQLKEISKDNNLPIKKIILLPSIISIICFMNYKTPDFSIFQMDEFHKGELILPWDQFINHNLKMYSEFVPVQGMYSVALGSVNSMFLDGSYSTFFLANIYFSFFIVAFITFFVCFSVGNSWGFFLLIFNTFLFNNTSRLSFSLLLFSILINPNLIKKPLVWLILYIIGSILNILYIPAIGLIFSISILPFAILISYKEIKNNLLEKKEKTYIIFILLLILSFLLYLKPLLLEIITFLKENGSGNTTAYGIGLLSNYDMGDTSNKLFKTNQILKIIKYSIKISFDLFRIGGWLFGISFIILLFFKNNRTIEQFINPATLISCIAILFPIGLIPYSIGRIDYGLTISRTGLVSLAMLGFFIPINILFVSLSKRKEVFSISLGLILGSILSLLSFYSLVGQVTNKLLSNPLIGKSELLYINGKDIGIPKLGNTFLDKNQLEEIKGLDKITKLFLKEYETYFDLTNRSIAYFIINRKVPVSYSADYLDINYEIQSKILNQLDKSPPLLVWLSPYIRFDGGNASPALRNYRVYNWLMNNNGYQYYKDGNLEFLVRNDRYLQIFKLYKDKLKYFPNKINDNKALDKIFHELDLKYIPISWGQSFELLKDRFKESPLKITDEFNSLEKNQNNHIWKIEKSIFGNQFDFIQLSMLNDLNISDAQIYWSNENKTFNDLNSFKFKVKNGTLLIPMGSAPYWLKDTNIRYLKLKIVNTDVKNINIKLLKLIK